MTVYGGGGNGVRPSAGIGMFVGLPEDGADETFPFD